MSSPSSARRPSFLGRSNDERAGPSQARIAPPSGGSAAAAAASVGVHMSVPLVHIDDIEFSRDVSHGDRFEAKIAPVSQRIGARKLGYNVTAVAPGKRAFPFHNHHANEEMFFVLDGEGTLRFGGEEFPVRKGHFIACPPGGTAVAHQLINTGT